MAGPEPGRSPRREAGPGQRRAPGRRVRFRLPHTAIPPPSGREEERLFYRRLEALVGPGPGGFAPLFAAEGWSDLTEDRLLRKRVVQNGSGGARARPGQEVSVKVLGALEDGELVERDPRLSFVPGHGDVVQALELGVPTMQLEEVAFFLAASPYCYGHPGREPDVPPEAPLLFEVTLLEVRDPAPQPLPPATRLRLSGQRRERGNFHFARGDFAAALRSYRLALSALDGPDAAPPAPQEDEELREQRVKCLNNCAAAALKLEREDEALAACDAALRISPDNGRALLRRGQLLARRGWDAEATLDLRRALELDPASKVIHAELSRLVKRRSAPQGPSHCAGQPTSPGCVGAGCEEFTAAPPAEPRGQRGEAATRGIGPRGRDGRSPTAHAAWTGSSPAPASLPSPASAPLLPLAPCQPPRIAPCPCPRVLPRPRPSRTAFMRCRAPVHPLHRLPHRPFDRPLPLTTHTGSRIAPAH